MRIPAAGRRRAVALLVGLCATLMVGIGQAQRRVSTLTEGEVEKLRDAAYFPADRVMVFVGFLDQRTKQMDRLTMGRRQPGREEDLHDLMEQFTSIADDFQDNLDDYNQHHRDVRKTLPKVVAATERWGTALRTPPEHPTYTVSRKLALEALVDIHQTAVKMLEDQRAWFLAHPPAKDDGKQSTPRS
jgi:hypothetical protein